MRLVSIGLVVSAVLMLAMWLSARQRQDSVAKMIAQPEPTPPVAADPGAAAAATPEARADQSRLAFERQARAFLRDAPRLDDATRMARARALSDDIGRREQNRELSGDEAMMMRVGLIQVAVKDPRERAHQVQDVINRHHEQNALRQRALLAQQRHDEKLKAYKTQEAIIVAEVLAMQSYPGGLSRDAYLRQRLQAARETINHPTINHPTVPAATP